MNFSLLPYINLERELYAFLVEIQKRKSLPEFKGANIKF